MSVASVTNMRYGQTGQIISLFYKTCYVSTTALSVPQITNKWDTSYLIIRGARLHAPPRLAPREMAAPALKIFKTAPQRPAPPQKSPMFNCCPEDFTPRPLAKKAAPCPC